MVYQSLKAQKVEVKSLGEAKTICNKGRLSILTKATRGGGGKGMKIVEKESDLENMFLTAKNEAKNFLVTMNFI